MSTNYNATCTTNYCTLHSATVPISGLCHVNKSETMTVIWINLKPWHLCSSNYQWSLTGIHLHIPINHGQRWCDNIARAFSKIIYTKWPDKIPISSTVQWGGAAAALGICMLTSSDIYYVQKWVNTALWYVTSSLPSQSPTLLCLELVHIGKTEHKLYPAKCVPMYSVHRHVELQLSRVLAQSTSIKHRILKQRLRQASRSAILLYS